jgi:hypothetical protein
VIFLLINYEQIRTFLLAFLQWLFNWPKVSRIVNHNDVTYINVYYSLGYPYDHNVTPPSIGSIFSWNKDAENTLRLRIASIQNKIVVRFPRRKGSGWKRQKFHELLHTPRDITKYGLPWNYDSGWGERSLKEFAKAPAKSCRKVYSDDFLVGISERVYERTVVDKALDYSRVEAFAHSKTDQNTSNNN